MVDLTKEIRAFEKSKPALIQEHGETWVIFLEEELKGHFDSFKEAAGFAISEFGNAPFLIRNTIEPPLQVPIVAVEG